MVANVCRQLSVPHSILTVEWSAKPATAIQEKARIQRYRRLSRWLGERGLDSLVTAHHADDQAETLMMRLNRGAGARGLAGIRPVARIPGGQAPLLRPLLGWRRGELEAVCAAARLEPARDPGNCDDRFERVRVRRGLSNADWLDPAAIARSAAHLEKADSALDWAARREWDRRVERSDDDILYRPDAPDEIRRRIVIRALVELAREGQNSDVRGRELDRLLGILSAGGKATLRGIACRGGDRWSFAPAPPRRR